MYHLIYVLREFTKNTGRADIRSNNLEQHRHRVGIATRLLWHTAKTAGISYVQMHSVVRANCLKHFAAVANQYSLSAQYDECRREIYFNTRRYS